MEKVFAFAVLAIPSLLVITNPLLVGSVFLSLTSGSTLPEQRTVAWRTSVVSFIILFVFALTGTLIFRLFSITIGAFQITGGIILFSVALGMLQAKPSRLKQTPEEIREAMSRSDVAVVPLAIPMLAGPGAITTVIVLAGEARATSQMVTLFVSIVIVIIVCWLFLRNAARLQTWMGATVLNVVTRLFGLILAAEATQIIINGVLSVLPLLKKAMKG